ncbi:MAG: hypothetical protein ACYCQK_02005 [Acidiferrobacteraceae bacterium]
MRGADAMNYYDARQRQDDKRWDYTRMNDGRIWPVGYCASKAPCECVTIERGYSADPGCQTCSGSGRVANPDYCGSHDTAEEARACFARYLLDGAREEGYGDWTGCEVCDTPTKKGLTTRPGLGHGYALCDEHRTMDQLRELAPADAGQVIASY